jgi:hypothetical protein
MKTPWTREPAAPAEKSADAGRLSADQSAENDPDEGGDREVAALVARLTSNEEMTKAERGRALASLTKALIASARLAGVGALAGGKWLADTLVDTAPRIPMRDLDTLQRQFPGLPPDDLAQAIISGAAKATAAVGVAGGALAAVEFSAPPTLLSVPVQIAAETLAVAAIEVKLVAELHEVYGSAVPGPLRTRALSYLMSWGDRRGIDPRNARALTTTLSITARAQLRRRVLRRAGRNLSTMGPILTGAALGATVNMRETRRLGDKIRRDLRDGVPAPPFYCR